MGSLTYKPRTLDEYIVKDGLIAVSTLDNAPYSKDLWFVVGGIATQSYLPTSCRRPTTDIDLAVLRPLTNLEFKEFAKVPIEYLSDSGYNVNTRKGHNTYMILYDKDKEGAVIEFARKNKTNFARIEKRLKKEYESTRKKLIEGTTETVRVSSPEDIAVPKLVRSINNYARNKGLVSCINSSSLVPLTEKDIKSKLAQIKRIREEAILNIGDPRTASFLRFVSDLYDIRVLSELTGFNEQALIDSFKRWTSFKEHPKQARQIIEYTLPRLNLDNLL